MDGDYDLPATEYLELESQYTEASKMLNALLRTLRP